MHTYVCSRPYVLYFSLLSTGISLTSTKSVVCLGGKNRPSSSSRRRFRPRSAACLSFAFIVVVAAALFVPTAEAKKRPIRRLDCTPMKDSKTYYLQNQCYDGLVTVRNRKKVVAQSARIDKNSPEGKITFITVKKVVQYNLVIMNLEITICLESPIGTLMML